MKIVLIYGSSDYNQKPVWLSKLTKPISNKLFGKLTETNRDLFEEFLKNKEFEVFQFKWSENTALSEIRREAKQLHRILKKEEKVIIIAKGNGGLLAQYALLGLNYPLIQIATPNIQTKTDLHIINIYSNTDKIQKAGIQYYQVNTGHAGSRKLYGEHVRNIAMDGLSYQEFDNEKQFIIYEDIIRKITHKF